MAPIPSFLVHDVFQQLISTYWFDPLVSPAIFSFLFVGIELISSITLEIPSIMLYYFVDHIRNLRENP